MNDAAPSQTEAPETPTVFRDWESSPECTQFILAWSLKIHTKREPTIFDVLREELARRRGLLHYGVKMKARPRLTGRVSSVLSGTASGQTIAPLEPKLLSNERAA